MASTNTEPNLAHLQNAMAEEADAIDQDRDAPITERSIVTRGHGRTKVLQIRLNDDELTELERLAATRGLPPSTVAREAILRLLNPEASRRIEGRRLAAELRRFVDDFMTDDAPAESQHVVVGKATTTRGRKR
jgi:uncharacterized protein YbaP (TraB family)